MSVQIIPTRRSAHFEQTTRLDGRAYVLRFDWHQRWGRWTIGLYSPDGAAYAVGLTLVPGFDLLQSFHHDPNVPPGALILADQSGEGRAPTYESLGEDSLFALLYIPTDSSSGSVEATASGGGIPGGFGE